MTGRPQMIERPDPHPLVKLLAIVAGAAVCWLVAGGVLVLVFAAMGLS